MRAAVLILSLGLAASAAPMGPHRAATLAPTGKGRGSAWWLLDVGKDGSHCDTNAQILDLQEKVGDEVKQLRKELQKKPRSEMSAQERGISLQMLRKIEQQNEKEKRKVAKSQNCMRMTKSIRKSIKIVNDPVNRVQFKDNLMTVMSNVDVMKLKENFDNLKAEMETGESSDYQSPKFWMDLLAALPDIVSIAVPLIQELIAG
jgi:hypothetical protein